jgi:hypothetical protein
MNKMIAVTISPGATTAMARLTCPFACRSLPPQGCGQSQERATRSGKTLAWSPPSSMGIVIANLPGIDLPEDRPFLKTIVKLARAPPAS